MNVHPDQYIYSFQRIQSTNLRSKALLNNNQAQGIETDLHTRMISWPYGRELCDSCFMVSKLRPTLN